MTIIFVKTARNNTSDLKKIVKQKTEFYTAMLNFRIISIVEFNFGVLDINHQITKLKWLPKFPLVRYMYISLLLLVCSVSVC